MKKKTPLWRQNQELKRKVNGIKEIRNRMWNFIVKSGLEDRYDVFCETGDTDNVGRKLMDKSLFIALSGLEQDYNNFKSGSKVFNYKSEQRNWANRFLEQESTYLKMLSSLEEANAKLWDKLLNKIEKDIHK